MCKRLAVSYTVATVLGMPTALRQVCTDCGYVYDPAEYGDIPLIDRTDWECPGINGPCGASADKYDIVTPISDLDDESEEILGDDENASESPIETAIQTKVLEATRAEKAVIDLARMFED